MVGEGCGQGGSCLFTLICSYSFVRRRDQYNILYKMYMYLYCIMYILYFSFAHISGLHSRRFPIHSVDLARQQMKKPWNGRSLV